MGSVRNHNKPGHLILLTAITLALIHPYKTALGASYDDLLSNELTRCNNIDPKAYESGLMFNPEGYRSLYKRSACLQRTAIKFRKIAMCDQVKQRRTLFSSSWGYSKGNCRKLVKEGQEKDLQRLQRIKANYQAGPVKLRDFKIVPNGNGRDFDIIPNFDNGLEHPYTLTFSLLPTPSTSTTLQEVLLDSSGFYLKGEKNNIRIYVRQSEIRDKFPAFDMPQSYPVRATLVLSVGTGNQSGRWSDTFIQQVFPTSERTQVVERVVRFYQQ